MATARKAERTGEDWISLAEAARMLGETRQTVLVRTVKGEVVAQHIAGRTFVSRASIEKLLAKK